jgi:hypothetical protein
VAGHGDTRGLDLTVRDVRRLESLDAEVAEGDRGAAGSLTGALGVVLLAVLGPPGNQYGSGLLL